MKIGIYSPYLNHMRGGEKYILTLAECLQNDNNVDIFWNPKEEQRIKDSAKERFELNLKKVTFVENIFSPSYSPLTRLKRTKQYDYLIILSDGSIPTVLSKKTIIHFQFPVEWINPSIITKLKVKRSSVVICNSEFTKSYIDRKFGIKSKVIYPPVTIKKENVQKENIIMNVGGFATHDKGSFKKQEVLIDAFKKLSNFRPEKWKLVLLGNLQEEDTDLFNSLKERAKGLHIEFYPNANYKTLWKFYNLAKVYWHASGFGEDLKKHPELAEHFGISTVEAMGAGAVPVVYNAGGQKEIIEQGKNGFLWNTEEELLHVTKDLINNPSRLAEVSKDAEIRAQDFSTDAFCEQITKVIK